mmetsp:Transcript_462/g.681  ORF Transcript_462/g.681 Transcript_462/m.681 type:complete len:503 (-) Transcript_462:38-1546(-)
MIRQRESANSPSKGNGTSSSSTNGRPKSPSTQKRSGGSQRPPLFYLCFGAFVGIVGYASLRPHSKSCSMDVALWNAAGSDGNAIVTITTPPQYYAYQPDIKIKASKRLFSKMPKGKERNFYAHMSKICHPMVRALRDQGWHKVDKKEDARVIYTYVRETKSYPTLKSWQRYNHIANTAAWNKKDNFASGFRRYHEETGVNPYFLPETFDLTVSKEKEEFQKRLFEEGGLDRPWVLKEPNVNQGKGITMLGPQTDELKNVLKFVADQGRTRYIIQQYICNEMTWQQRKFDVRVFWLVASMDPLIVLYIDGYVRIGNADYDESDFSNTRNHLTTHTFLGEEGKASYEQLNQKLVDHVEEHPELKATLPTDPATHVRNQFKESIGMLVDTFKKDTFKTGPPLAAEDGFEFYGADCVLDNELDMWMIEAQDDTGMDEDHYFRLEMHHQIFYGMGLVLAEIWDKQAKGLPILPLKNAGKWEVVYADGWRYKYDEYERSKNKKSCGLK